MVTERKNRRATAKKAGMPGRRPFYLKEWRKFMGAKPIDLAVALDIERQSYHRLEKNWWTISLGELDTICDVIGIRRSQLNSPPPNSGQELVNLDDLLDDIPKDMQPAAILALRGMAGNKR